MEKFYVYKDSGIKWLGKIPQHWEVRKIKYVFTERSEKGYPEEPVLCSTQKYGVIPQYMYESHVVVVNKGLEGLKLVRKGDFVISLRSFQGGIEYAYYQGIISAAYTILNLNDNCYSNYIKYLMKSFDFIQLLQTCVTGIREGQNINYPLLRKSSLPLPPLAEQRAIVSYLDGKVGQIDTYIAKQTQQIELLKELKQAVIANAVTKGIANDNNHHTKLKQSGISWIGEIPEHWEVKRLGLFFTENKTINSCMQCTEAYKFNYGTLIRKDEDIDPNELKDTYNKYTILKPRDIVINGLNLNYDFVSQRVALSTSTGIITSAYIVLSPRTRVHELFFYYLLKSMDGMKLFHGMGTGIRLTLSFKDLKYQLLPIPPLSEQRAIVSYIEAKTANINKLIDAYQQQVERVKEYKQRLISDAVTGKMNVTGKQTQTN
jgi:hypothetical protein